MRRDWWRFWVAVRAAAGFTRGSVSLTLIVGGKERCIGFRLPSRYAEETPPPAVTHCARGISGPCMETCVPGCPSIVRFPDEQHNPPGSEGGDDRDLDETEILTLTAALAGERQSEYPGEAQEIIQHLNDSPSFHRWLRSREAQALRDAADEWDYPESGVARTPRTGSSVAAWLRRRAERHLSPGAES